MALVLSRDATCYGSTVRLSSAIILIDIMMMWKGQGSRDGGVGGHVVQSLQCNHYIHEWTWHSAAPNLLPAPPCGPVASLRDLGMLGSHELRFSNCKVKELKRKQ